MPNEKVPHKHHDLIIAWAKGETIQYYNPHREIWIECHNGQPEWSSLTQYRVKPEPKPDIVKYGYVLTPTIGPYDGMIGYRSDRKGGENLKFTWAGETGLLKSVEII